MPAKANNEVHNCEYFSWRMYRRDNIYYADGRGAEIGLRRLSLGTRDRDQALKNLRILDRRKAIEVGKIMREGRTLECISQDYTLKWDICICSNSIIFRGHIMKGIFDIDCRDIIGQKDNFVGMKFMLILSF